LHNKKGTICHQELVSRARLIKTIDWQAPPTTIMRAAQHYPDVFGDVALPKHELLMIHRSKISLHHEKNGFDYPTIRLPHTFSRLAGLSTRIYQTVQDGALAFLVVISARKNASDSPESPVLT
jgi:hypothetical protein